MMRPPHWPAGGSFSSSVHSTRSANVADADPRPQASILEGIHIGRVWKSPRDKTRSIEGVLREFNGNQYAEFREYVMDDYGRMVPTDKRLTVSTKRLGQFAALVGNTYRRAEKLGLTPVSS